MHKIGLLALCIFLVFITASATTSVPVVSYNLFWWWVSSNNQFPALYRNIRQQNLFAGGFSLMGFQECDNVAQVLANTVGLRNWSFYEVGSLTQSAPMAWNSERYSRIRAGTSVVARDQFGDRVLNWVRLEVRHSGKTIFFANTHGPLGQSNGAAGHALADNYIRTIQRHIQPGDELIFTGDFNCIRGSATMQRLSLRYKIILTGTSFGGVDHILIGGSSEICPPLGCERRIVPGSPSDHTMIRATFTLFDNSTHEQPPLP